MAAERFKTMLLGSGFYPFGNGGQAQVMSDIDNRVSDNHVVFIVWQAGNKGAVELELIHREAHEHIGSINAFFIDLTHSAIFVSAVKIRAHVLMQLGLIR